MARLENSPNTIFPLTYTNTESKSRLAANDVGFCSIILPSRSATLFVTKMIDSKTVFSKTCCMGYRCYSPLLSLSDAHLS